MKRNYYELWFAPMLFALFAAICVLLFMSDLIGQPVESLPVEKGMEITFVHYLIAFLAYILNVFQKLYSAKKKGQKLTFGYYIQRNWIDHVLSVISIVILFMLGGEVLQALNWAGVSENTVSVLENGTKLLAFIFGWANYSIVKVAVGIFKKKEVLK
jgi:hypothetical protein